MTRQEKSEMHYNLINIITDCNNDVEMFSRLIYALEIITNEINRFENTYKEKLYNSGRP